MAIIKCKMCGGDLNLIAGETVAECEYCGTRQTVPSADNEKKLTLFSRANRLRAGNEFDKAAGVYESIVADFPEEAEAYWGLVLCKYGIEYVDDPATGKKIPTCHRSSFDSVMDDNNFDMACEYADMLARNLYRQEAKQIEEIRKGIIEVSGKEEPYDIFICYKETAEFGGRTLDSVLAQDVYDALTAKGYRVFFSRITLEDKLGQEYEPYIFAALNSAKIMLAFGTCYDHFNAVWVKNEWSRYLQLMNQDKQKHLIPCYKDIDAYDMPKEFARLQAQDLGKVGAVQDLLRGIEKILPREKPQVAAGPQMADIQAMLQQALQSSGGNGGDGGKAQAALKRGNAALEFGEWDEAFGFFEKVLDVDAENAEAHLGQLFAQLHITQESQLEELGEVEYWENKHYKMALRYCKDSQRQRLEAITDRARPAALARKQARLDAEEAERRRVEAERQAAEELARRYQRGLIRAKEIVHAANYSVIALKADGAVESYGKSGQWKDIVQVASCGYSYYGLRKDGTVEYDRSLEKRAESDEIRTWRGVKKLIVGNSTSSMAAAILQDGTMRMVGIRKGDNVVRGWKNIVSAAIGNEGMVAIQADGRALSLGAGRKETPDVSRWQNIAQAYAGALYYAGLTKAGSMVSTDPTMNSGGAKWTGVITMAAGFNHVLGLRKDGTVLAQSIFTSGSSIGAGRGCEVSTWRGIVQVAAGQEFSLGLKMDGTVVATGKNDHGQCDVSHWQDVIAIAAGNKYCLGLRKDGTLYYAGEPNANGYKTDKWKLFDDISDLG